MLPAFTANGAGVTTPSASISVVVVTFNGRDLVRPCLESICRQTLTPAEVIVVDNDSSDGTAAFVRGAFPSVRVIELSRNLGFAGGANHGIEHARGEYVAFLNADATAGPTWLANMAQAIQDRPDVGMVASQMVFRDDPLTINSAGISVDRAGVAWDRGGGEPAAAYADVAESFGACAGAALYRCALFDDVGRFDEDFFMYLEDVDLAWRARLAGWRCVYVPDARVEHVHSATAGKHSPFKRYHLARNKVWLIAKDYPFPDLLIYLPAILLVELGAIIRAILARQPDLSWPARLATIRGRLDGLASLAIPLRKRACVQDKRRVPLGRFRATLAPFSLPWTYVRRYAYLFDAPPDA